jgi:hypothetical protein
VTSAIQNCVTRVAFVHGRRSPAAECQEIRNPDPFSRSNTDDLDAEGQSGGGLPLPDEAESRQVPRAERASTRQTGWALRGLAPLRECSTIPYP